MSEITDEFMRSMLGRSRVYSVVLLKLTSLYKANAAPESEQARTIWAHGRRNFELRASGKMPMVGPLFAPPLAGLAVFTVEPEEVEEIMRGDPAVKAGYFTFEVLPWRTFPGDGLPPA